MNNYRGRKRLRHFFVIELNSYMYNSNVVVPTVFHNAFKRIRLSEDVVREGGIFGFLFFDKFLKTDGKYAIIYLR